MQFTFDEIVTKVNVLHEKYEAHHDRIWLRSEIEVKHYGLKLNVQVVDLHPDPVEVANVTIRLMYAGSGAILDSFLESIDLTIEKLLDLYEMNHLPVIEQDDDVPDLV